MNGAMGTKVIDHRSHIIGIVVHVMAIPYLARATMAAAVVRHHTKPLGREEQHLGIPVIGTERPAMVEMDDLRIAGTPVFVEDLNAVFGCDVSHACISCVGEVRHCPSTVGLKLRLGSTRSRRMR